MAASAVLWMTKISGPRVGKQLRHNILLRTLPLRRQTASQGLLHEPCGFHPVATRR